jgi:hypothetical protein
MNPSIGRHLTEVKELGLTKGTKRVPAENIPETGETWWRQTLAGT